ncbi:MAG TPA: sterol desaturase family protein [Thermoleophilaceae bacterium]|nr:sterol desaturase family protein [Thermoleophilaceae bacterium]
MEMRRSETLLASPRMFDSDLLDRLSRVHHSVPPLIFGPAIAVLFALGQENTPVLPAVAWLAGGFAFWTLFEYWMHRVVFHLEPEKGIGARLHWIIHGVHHDHPNDPMRLVMPPSVSVPLSAALVGVFWLVLGAPGAYLFGAGFLAGYLVYDMTHYHLHHRMPRTRVGRLLYELHMRHHFQDDTRGFGVSAPWWDYVFGTSPRRRPSG